MIRTFLLWTTFLILTALATHGQSAKKNYKIIGRNNALKATAIKRSDNFKYYLLIQNNNKTDSLLLGTEGNVWDHDTCYISQRQPVHSGQKEITVELSHSFSYSASHRSVVDSNYIFQIWNLSERIKTFNAIAFSSHEGTEPLPPVNIEEAGDTIVISDACAYNCVYSYDLAFAKNGQIIIDNLKIISDENECTGYYSEMKCKLPDHKEGIYSLTNGQYILLK